MLTGAAFDLFLMASQVPPPLPKRKGNKLPLPIKILLLGCFLAGICVFGLVGLRVFGLVGIYSTPTGGMSPAVSPGDNVFTEGLTYRKRKPFSGEIIVFKTDGLPSVPSGQVYMKRLVGLPGDRISISQRAVFVNGVRTSFRNRGGEIAYVNPQYSDYMHMLKDGEVVTVPDGQYFVLGDDSEHSADSRLWGCVPAVSVIGRVAFCYWPPKHMGGVQ